MKYLVILVIISLLNLKVYTNNSLQTRLGVTQSDPSMHFAHSSLKFQNQTGKCFGSSQLNSLINILNQASTLYRSNYQQNLIHIQQNMDAAFGSQTQRYNVFIQGSSLGYQGAFLVYPIGEGGCNFVSLIEEVNLINPDWSYLIVKNVYLTYSPSFVYVGGVSKGRGVPAQKKKQIENIIMAVERGQFTCLCLYLSTIAKNIKAGDGQDWTVICRTGDFTHSYFAAKQGQWIYTKPAECSYLLYVQ